MHRLQKLFATEEGEKAFERELLALFESGRFDAAESLLATELETLEGPVADICRATGRGAVAVGGWEDLIDVATTHEGEPVSAALLVASNEDDVAFEKGKLHEPILSVGLFTDEVAPFSQSDAAELVALGKDPEGPVWTGESEDVEVYLELDGFGELNTALLFHKQRHFFRDEAPDEAPLRYVDFVIGCWWRALRFQQAVAAANARNPLPGGVRAMACVAGMRPELVGVHGEAVPEAASETAASRPVVEMAGIDAAEFIQRRPVEEVEELTGTGLRRRFANSEPDEQETEPAGFLGRLFGRGSAA